MIHRAYTSPGGTVYSLFEDMLNQPHLLIAGATGSGKSVVINGLMFTALTRSPPEKSFILIDQKRVELVEFKRLPHVLRYASEPGDMVQALLYAVQLVEDRYREMQTKGLKKFPGGAVYVVIDELADLMTTNKKEVQPILQRLAQIGRAANVHIIGATQCPLSTVIPTAIKVNFDSRMGLRTRSAQDSRNILGVTGCETLPRYGQGYYMTADGITLYNIPMIEDSEKERLLKYWSKNARPHWTW